MLVAALLVPVVGALVAFLVPSGRSRRPLRRFGRSDESSDDLADEAEPEITLIVADPDSVPEPAAVARAGATSRTAVRIAALAAAGLWTAIVLLGGATAGQLSAQGPVGPAGAGASLLLASVSRPARRGAAVGGALALSLLTAGLALAGGSASGGPTLAVLALAGGAAVITVTTAKENDGGIAAATLALVGMVGVAGGLVQVEAAGTDATTAAGRPLGAGVFLVAGGTLIATAGGLRPRRSASMLLPVGLAVGVAAGATLGALGEGTALVLAFGAVAVAAGWAVAPEGRGGVRLLVVALALMALAVAAVPIDALPGSPLVEGRVSPGVPAAWLVATAAVVAGVVLVPSAALSAVPGAAAFAVVVAAEPSPAGLGVAGLAVAAVVAAAVAVARSDAAPQPGPGDAAAGLALSPLVATVPALAVGAWLLVAPRTWAWVGDTNLVNWTESVALALAGGLIGVVAAGATGRLAVPRSPHVVAPDPVMVVTDPPVARRAALVAGVALGLTLLALVASS